jgi:anti-sigma B factor antagonist
LAAESTVVLTDRVVTVTSVRTTASDEWRAALALNGELDVANAHELRAELNRHLDAGRRVIRVDASRVEFVDSTAISELTYATERCRAEHGSLILTNVPHCMRRLITVAGLDHVLLVDTAGAESREASA